MVTQQPHDGNGTRSHDAGAPRSSRFGTAPPEQEANPLQPLFAHLAEMREYVAYYLTTSADSVKLTVRNLVLYAVLGCLALIVGAALLVTAAVLTLDGIADGLTRLLDGHAWAAKLITGISVLVFAALGAWLGLKSLTKSSRQKTIDKYEHRLQQQRAAFGHDVHDQARSRPTPEAG